VRVPIAERLLDLNRGVDQFDSKIRDHGRPSTS